MLWKVLGLTWKNPEYAPGRIQVCLQEFLKSIFGSIGRIPEDSRKNQLLGTRGRVSERSLIKNPGENSGKI